MKRFWIGYLMLAAMSAVLFTTARTATAEKVKEIAANPGTTGIVLSDAAWKLKPYAMDAGETEKAYAPGLDESGFKTVAVPAEIQLTTGLKGMDLFKQSKAIALINKSEWWYRKSFTAPKLRESERVRLVFERSDYFTSVWLNGEKLGDHEGAYATFSFDITSKIKPGQSNLLAVKVTCPWLPKGRGLQEYNKSSFTIVWPSPALAFATPPYALSFGWNQIPAQGNAVLTIGLTGDVKLIVTPARSVEDVYVYTKSLNRDGSATLAITGTVRNYGNSEAKGTVELELKPQNFAGSAQRLARLEMTLRPGENEYHAEAAVKNPKLWWTWDTGTPNLYKLAAKLTVPGQAETSRETTMGIRTVVRKPDMSYWINGKHVFLKGAWYAMASYFASQNTRASYFSDLALLKAANANYILDQLIERDSFYDLCDEMGLMVFTQMPFNQPGPFYTLEANNPRREVFLKTAFEQGAEMVREHRNHPSVTAWAPLAESTWSDWAKKEYIPFYEGMREVVRKLSPDTIYQRSYCDDGEEHIWMATAGMGGVGGGVGDYRYHFDFSPSFVSEYGSDAMSSYENLHKWISDEDLWSDKNPRRAEWFYLPINVNSYTHMGSTAIASLQSILAQPIKYVDGDPRSAKELVEASQLYQDFIMHYASDAFRRKMFSPIQGIRWWEYKDSGPSLQSGFVDVDGVPRIAYYSFKRAMAPLAVSFGVKSELEGLPDDEAMQWGSTIVHIPVTVVNDYAKEIPLDVKSEVLDLKGRVIFSHSVDVAMGAGRSQTVDVLDWEVPKVTTTTVYALRATVQEQNGALTAEKRMYLKVMPTDAVPAADQAPKLEKKPRVLLIASWKFGEQLANELRALGVTLDVIDQGHLDRFSELRNADELKKKYDVIWLGSFEAIWKVLDDDMAEGVAQAVKDGVGLIHTGGESSFHGGEGIAACLDLTKLAEVLPVKVRPEAYDLSLLNSSKDVRVFAYGWTDAGLKSTGIPNFNEVETKDGSDVVMKFEDWPLLVTGQYGKGHTVAFMGFTPRDKTAQATWRAMYAQMLLAATGENPEYRYASATGKTKPVYQLLKEQPRASVTVTPAAIGVPKAGEGWSFKVAFANGERFARLLRMRMEWSDAQAQAPTMLYGDNYFDLFPGEKREVSVDVRLPDGATGATKGTLIVEGTNVPEMRVPVVPAGGK